MTTKDPFSIILTSVGVELLSFRKKTGKITNDEEEHLTSAIVERVVRKLKEHGCYQTDGREELEKYKQEYDDLKRKIESLTPGGSEFYNDPEYCLKFLRENDSQVKSIMRHQKDQITALQSSLKEKEEVIQSSVIEYQKLYSKHQHASESLKEKEKIIENLKKQLEDGRDLG